MMRNLMRSLSAISAFSRHDNTDRVASMMQELHRTQSGGASGPAGTWEYRGVAEDHNMFGSNWSSPLPWMHKVI